MRFEVCAPYKQGFDLRGVSQLAGYAVVFRKPGNRAEHPIDIHFGLDVSQYPFNDPNRKDEQRERITKFITQCLAGLPAMEMRE